MKTEHIGQYWYNKHSLGPERPPIDAARHTCCRCKKPRPQVKKVAGTGTSRHNPAKWVCLPCLDGEKSN